MTTEKFSGAPEALGPAYREQPIIPAQAAIISVDMQNADCAARLRHRALGAGPENDGYRYFYDRLERLAIPNQQKIRVMKPQDVFDIMRRVLMQDEKIDRDKEHFWVMGLMTDSTIHFIELVSLGTLGATLVHPREVFRLAIQKGTARVILVHNHPSGNLMASEP